jgi:alpha-tubulin suppressor-like RCC1 family protein
MGHACVIRTDRSVWCWGGDYRPFGQSVPNLNYPFVGGLPHRVVGVSDVAALGSSEYSVCARKQDGTVWCWGHGDSGQLGDGTTAGRKEAAQVPGLAGVTMLEGGRFHECAVGAFNGAQGVWCWGRGGQGGRSGTANPELGRLGNNDIVDHSTPVAVDLSAAASAAQTVRALSVGSYHSCIVMSDDTVWCWGRGDSGQLGDGLDTDTKIPVQVSFANLTIPGGVTVDQVGATDGNSFSGSGSCMLLSNGTAYCWGNSALGDGTGTSRNTPTTAVNFAALAGDKPVELRTGFQQHCVRTMANDLWCWGRNKAGALGNGNTSGGTALRVALPPRSLVSGSPRSTIDATESSIARRARARR